jgi:hypothetical protein
MREKLCECGCGGIAPLAKRTRTDLGHVKGQPVHYIPSHNFKVKRGIEERFWEKVNKQGPRPSAQALTVHPDIAGQPCWVWIAHTHSNGYGRFALHGAVHNAHRVAWFLEHGTWPIPSALN